MEKETTEAANERLDLLKKEREARQEAEKALAEAQAKNAELSDQYAQLKQDMDVAKQESNRLVKELDRVTGQLNAAECQAARWRNLVRQERIFWKEKIRKPLTWPCLGMAGFAILTCLIGACIDSGLMSSLLGEPLGYGSICVCAFFGGIVWDRSNGGRIWVGCRK